MRQHVIPSSMGLGQLPFPHFIMTPALARVDFYTAILPDKYEMEVGDEFGEMRAGEFVKTGVIKKIEERRPAKGDWSKNICKSPDFIKFTT